MKIPFTQYMRPNGRKEIQHTDVPEEIGKLANILIESGCQFTSEALPPTGEFSIKVSDAGVIGDCKVSFTCERYDKERDEDDILSSEICENGPEVTEAINRLIKNAYKNM